MPIRRRSLPFGPGPGDQLLLPASLSSLLTTVEQFAAFSGVNPTSLIAHPAGIFPIPTEPIQTIDVTPQAAWHPLFWLPRRLREPLSEGDSIEDIPAHVVRVLSELQMSAPFETAGAYWIHLWETGQQPFSRTPVTNEQKVRLVRPATSDDTNLLPIFDPTDGTWLDIPYLVGVDTLTDEGRERMSRWLDGQPDTALDRLNLDAYMRANDRPRHWILNYLYRPLTSPDRDDPILVDAIIGTACHMLAYQVFQLCTTSLSDLTSQPVTVHDVAESFTPLDELLTNTIPGISDDTPIGQAITEDLRSISLSTAIEDLHPALSDLAMIMTIVMDIYETSRTDYTDLMNVIMRDITTDMTTHHGVSYPNNTTPPINDRQ